MAGKVLTSQIVDRKQITTTGTETVDLPKANFIKHILFYISEVSGTSPTFTLNRMTVVANGSANLFDLTGAQCGKYTRLKFRRNLQASGSTGIDTQQTTGQTGMIILFGRYIGDTDVILPAKAFRTLQLKINFTIGGTTPVYQYSVMTDEYVSDEAPKAKLLLKTTELEEKASASGIRDFDLPLGNLYRKFYIEVGTAPSGGGSTVEYRVAARINGGAEIPFTHDFWELTDTETLLYDLEANESTVAVIDFDYDATLRDIRDSAVYNDFKIRLDSSTTATTANLFAEELIRLA